MEENNNDKAMLKLAKIRIAIQGGCLVLVILGSVLAILGGVNFAGKAITHAPMAYSGIAVFALGLVVLVITEIVSLTSYSSYKKEAKDDKPTTSETTKPDDKNGTTK
jgi:Na+/melibiose symporter-like transporter